VPDTVSNASAKASVLSRKTNKAKSGSRKFKKDKKSAKLYILKKRAIETGLVGPGYVEVLSGLKKGDIILAVKNRRMKEGVKVMVSNVKDGVGTHKEDVHE